MRLTNKTNLPKYLADWLEKDDYDHNNDPRTFSATFLLKPLRVQIITHRHKGELEMDILELIASRMGSAIHDSIERVESEGFSKELRVERKLTVNDIEYTITGKYDVLEALENGKHRLRDIKTTSVWAFIHGGKDLDYIRQLSIYRWLLTPTHDIDETACIDFFFTDWQGMKARTESGYPQSRLSPDYKIQLMDPEKVEEKIIKKLKVYQEYENVPDDDLPECTPVELWSQPDTYAVYSKRTNKRATKVCETKSAAEQYMLDKNITDGYIEFRPGEVRRCKYCSAQPFCNQSQKLVKQGLLKLT